jgi:hypothetical protein
MADRYWVGGAGTWDATTTTNWAASSGGAGGASAPTSADNAIFDTLSNATLYTVTVGTNAVCNDLTVAAPLTGAVTFSLAATARLDPYGSMTLPAANCTWTGVAGALVTFRATTTGKTITTNGVTLTLTAVTFNGVGGAWTLGSALTYGTAQTLAITNGTFNTGNYDITGGIFAVNVVGTQVINLGSSTLTLSTTGSVTFSQTAGLTFNAGTSQINCSISSPTFTGGGQTFYNVSFTSAGSGTSTITGANTFNDLNQISRNATGTRVISLGDNQTVSGTLTLGTTNTSIRRIQVQSSVIGTQRTITLNGSLATLADCDFRDIGAAGTVATPWTGTRLGNGLNNNNITFDAAKDVYWNLAAGGDWSGTGWALSSGGAVAANNFPLAQDKAIFENTGLNTSATITLGVAWWIGEFDASTRSNAMTFGNSTATPIVYKNVTLSSVFTMTGTGAWSFVGQGTTQILDVNTATFTPPITINSATGTLQLAEDTTCSSTVTLTSGTLNLNNNKLSCNIFSSTNTNTRVIAFGTGNITTTGSGTVWTTATPTNFSRTGTPTVNISNNSATATTVSTGAMTEAQSLNFNYTIGTYTLTDTAARYRSVNFTGFSGTIPNSARTIFGGLTLSAGMTLTAGANATTFAATSGTQQITTAAKTLDFPLTFDGIGGTFAFQDALTQGSTRAFTITNGTVQLKISVTSTVGAFTTSGTNQKFLQSTLAGTQATISQASGTVNASYLTIQDIIATGGATWNAFTASNNVDAGNNSGWDFNIQLGRYIYTRRKNKRIIY